MRDIADQVGVSVNSVSKALRNKSEISPATREEIVRVAKDLGYSIGTRQRQRPDTGIIGLITTDSANPYFGLVIRGVQTAIRSAGYTMMLFNTDEDYVQERIAVELLVDHNVEGIILTPSQLKDDDIAFLESKDVPFVLLGRHFPGHSVPSVVSDDVQGAYDAISHLVRLGHRRILFLNGPIYISSARERLDGYLQAHKDLGVEVDETLVRQCAPDTRSAYNELNSAMLEDLDFSAIFSFNDIMMLGVVRLLRERAIEIPNHYSLVGFDDIDFSSLLTPALTTVAVDRHALGVQSAELLIKLIRGSTIISHQRVIPTRLVVRSTTQRI